MTHKHRRLPARVWVAGVASSLVFLALTQWGPPADARSEASAAPAARADSFSPWLGTVKVEWTYEEDGCDGCTSDFRIGRGALTYTLTNGRGSQSIPGWGYYTAVGSGAGSVDWEAVFEDGTSTCSATWTASAVENSNIGLSSVKPVVSVPYVWVTPTRTGNDCEAQSGDLTVGDVPGLDWEQTIADDSPGPDRWTGTSTFTGTDPDGEVNGEMRSYEYTVTVDLTRDARQPTTIVARALTSGHCLPTRCVANRVTVTGAIRPAIQVPLTVRLRSQRGGRWVLDGTKSVTSRANGAFSTAFGRPRGTPCRVDVGFAGNTKFAPSTWTKSLSC